MRFPIMTTDRARELVEALQRHPEQEIDIKQYEATSGAGDSLDISAIDAVIQECSTLQETHADDPKTFDGVAAAALHRGLPHEAEVVSNDGFWRWLAVSRMYRLIQWRFPPKAIEEEHQGGSTRINLQNFGIGASARQRAECYPYKLWLRGELAVDLDGGDDPYRYCLRGDVDFWTSHIHRQSYTTNRKLCSALIRFQYPDELSGAPRLVSGTESKEKGRFGIRTLAKRLRRLQASHELSILCDSELDELIASQAQDLTRA